MKLGKPPVVEALCTAHLAISLSPGLLIPGLLIPGLSGRCVTHASR